MTRSTPGEPEVRRAVVGDAAGIARCQGACWAEAYAGLTRPGFFDDRADGLGADRWAQVLGTPRVDVAVAALPGQVLGFASAGPSTLGPDEPDGSEAPRARQLFSLYLRSDVHGSGLADQLLAASLGPDPAFLWVFEDNPRARAFYARQGFRTDGASAVDGWTGLREVRMVR